MAGKENVIKAMVLAAKKTLVGFAKKLDDGIIKLVYGVNLPKIENELVGLEEEKKQNEVIYTKGNEQFPGIRSKETYDDTNQKIGEKKSKLLKSAQNPIKNFGIAPLTYQVQRINSFNLCNPLTLGINAAFPPGSPVSEGLRSVQADLKRIQDIFRNFRIIAENRIVTAESIPFPIREGAMNFQITSSSKIKPGTILYIQQTNNETISANMVGVVKENSAELATPEVSQNLSALKAQDNRDKSGVNSVSNPLGLTSDQLNVLNDPSLTQKREESTANEQFTGIDLGKLPRKARRKLKKAGLSTNISVEGTGDLQNARFEGTDQVELDAVKSIINSTPPRGADRKDYPPYPQITLNYDVEIQRFDPFDPPTEKDKAGNTILDADGDPVLQTFTNWQIEYATEQTSDIRELAEDLQGLTDALRDLGIRDIVATLNRLPKNFLGLGKLQAAMLEVALFIDGTVIGAANTLADETSTASQALSGGLTSQEVIRRSRLLSDFYNKLKPLIEFDLSLENIFQNEIKEINKTLRGVIPYEQLAVIVGGIKKFVDFVIKLTDFTLAILQFLNTIIKTLLVVAKVLRTVIKVMKAVAKALPAMFLTAGIINVFENIAGKVGEALDTAVPILEEFGEALDKMINALQFLRGWLVLLSSELAKLQQTFETCASLDDRLDELNLNNALQGLISVATGIPFPDNQVRNNVYDNFEQYTPLDLLGGGTAVSNQSQFGQVLVTTANGTIIVLPGTVWGFNSAGQIVFGGDLISGATGVNFEETRGQEFRRMLRDNFNFYTFNKFKDAKYANLVEQLQAQGVELYAQEVEQINEESVADKFGNFQETYLGYIIRIQEEKPIEDSPKGETNLTRRRGVAFDIDGKLSVASDLTFSDDLNLIVNETKFRIKRNINQGIIDVGTIDNQNFPDDDAIKLAETTGANPLAISNIKAQANNLQTNNIVPNQPADPTPVEMRTGNQPFKEAAGDPASIANDQSSPNKSLNPSDLIQQPFAEFISENPSLKKMQDTFRLLQGASMNELSDIMSEPGVFDLNGEELAEKLKNNIVGAINPNPEKVEEIKKKTEIWLEGLKKQTKIDYEQLTMNLHPRARSKYPPYEVYYDNIEIEELEKWILFLLSKGYTEEEIQAGLREEELRDEYKIKFNVKGKRGRILKVKLTRKNQRLRNKINR